MNEFWVYVSQLSMGTNVLQNFGGNVAVAAKNFGGHLYPNYQWVQMSPNILAVVWR